MRELVDFIRELTEFYADFSKLEREKRRVLITLNQEKLEEITSKEQPFVLKAKGLELRRKELVLKLGFAEKSLEDVVLGFEFSNDLEKQETEKLYSILKETILKFKQIIEENGELIADYTNCLKKNLSELESTFNSGTSMDVKL